MRIFVYNHVNTLMKRLFLTLLAATALMVSAFGQYA